MFLTSFNLRSDICSWACHFSNVFDFKFQKNTYHKDKNNILVGHEMKGNSHLLQMRMWSSRHCGKHPKYFTKKTSELSSQICPSDYTS